MRALIRNCCLIIAVLLLSVYSITPPSKKLRLGKDLAGGVSLTYSVQLSPGDPPDVVARVIDVLKKRVDPNGLSEISIVKQDKDRIEITMPLPGKRVKDLKEAYERELARLGGVSVDDSAFQILMRKPVAERAEELKQHAGGSPERAKALADAAAAFDTAVAARDEFNRAQADLKQAKDSNADQALIDKLTATRDAVAGKAADAELALDDAKKKCVGGTLTAAEVRKALSLSDEHRMVEDSKTRQFKSMPSAQENALVALRKRYPGQESQLNAILAAYERFAAERTPLDDSADLKRMLSGAGVLDFRITVDPGEHPQELRLRQELHERGPRNVQSTDARWFRINKLDNWFDSTDALEQLTANAPAYFRGQYGMVAEEHQGEHYILCWDTPGSRLTKAEGEWSVSGAYRSSDPQTGLPAISFEMNNRGGVLLRELTKPNVGKKMAVLLDDQVYTAPRLNSAIGKSGQITGSFDDRELNYIINVLAAGSLQAKLSPEPISEVTLAPEVGADNLNKGFQTGIIAFAIVAVFMVGYYFTCGFIAMIALAVNFLMVLAIMALNHAAFTLPGIAGIVLTFGQAIDSNVLVYERMREEFLRGADMRTAVRLGFSRASSAIIDGNLTNLIICVVLYYFGTTEIRGFAITLGIGVVTTLFTAVFVSRVIFTILVDHIGWSRASQLPMVFPALQRALTPQIDWMKWRWVCLGALGVFLLAGAVVWVMRGEKLLDTQFTGGTQIELLFKTDDKTGERLTLTREEVQTRVQGIAVGLAEKDPLKRVIADAEVLPVNPRQDKITSDRFQIKAGRADEKVLLAAVVHEFGDMIESRGALEFAGSAQVERRQAPVYGVVGRVLGESLSRPQLGEDVGEFVGGVAVLLEDIKPPVSMESLTSRLEQMRTRPEYSDTLARTRSIRVLAGSQDHITTAVVLVRDEGLSLFQDEDRWGEELARREWTLVRDALTHTTQVASVQNFSPSIATTFRAQAVVSVFLSIVLLTIYVWVRFGAARWATAATLPLFADVVGIVGLIAVAQMLYENPSTNGWAARLGLLPFRIDLNQIAALLTITGYSLNDKIIILDRIRENKGKLPYASYAVINDSINQTLSRTVITSGTTLISTVILYIFGGEAVRGFAYAFTLGVLIGTYTSIVSSPLVWSKAAEPTTTPPEPMPPSGGRVQPV